MSINTAPFVKLGLGQSFVFFAEDNPGTVPVTSEKTILREYSPFVLYAEPPPIIKRTTRDRAKVLSTFSAPIQTPNVQLSSRTPFIPYIPSNRLDAPLTKYTDPSSPILSDKYKAEDIALDMINQYNDLVNLPPISFLVNPSSFSISYTKVSQFSERTRYGYIYQAWGEELPEISISGRIGGYFAGRLTQESVDELGNTKGVSGMQFASKRDSGSFRWLMSLLSLYRNSCAIIDQVGRSEAVHAVGHQVIVFDGKRYRGRMTAFGYGFEEAQQNGGMEFTITFKVFSEEFLDVAQKTAIKPLDNPFTKEK